MLGDAGANASVPCWVSRPQPACDGVGRRIALAGVVAATLASERVSFSAVIEGRPPCARSTPGVEGRRDDVGRTRRRRRVVKAAALIAAVTVVARLVGFVRLQMMAQTIGTSCLGTAYTTANAVPNLVFEIVVGGALAGSVVPLLAGSLTAVTCRRLARPSPRCTAGYSPC